MPPFKNKSSFRSPSKTINRFSLKFLNLNLLFYHILFIFCVKIQLTQEYPSEVYNLQSNSLTENSYEDCMTTHAIQNTRLNQVPVSEILWKGQQLWGDVGYLKINKDGSGRNNSKLMGRRGKVIFPCWMDVDLVRMGQRFALQNFIQVGAGHYLSLLMLLANPQARQILYATGKSETPRKAFDRYAATGMQLQLWYREDIFSENWQMSVSTVRSIHDSMGRNLKLWNRDGKFSRPLVTRENNPTGVWPDANMWRAFQKDVQNGRGKLEARWGRLNEDVTYWNNFTHAHAPGPAPLFNQYLMAVTQWCFVALPVILPTRVGMPSWREEELMAFAHLWAVISYALGMDENYIPCRNPQDLPGCKKYLWDMFHVHIIPALYTVDFEGQIMIEALLKSVGIAAPGIPKDYFLIKILEDIVEIPATNLYKQTSWRSRLGRYFSKNWSLPIYSSPILRNLANMTTFAAMHWGSRLTFGDPGYNSTKVAQEFYVFK